MEKSDIRKATILVVDDSPDSITLLSSLLRGMYQVKVSTSGAKALEIAESGQPPDIILLDIMMPEMDGYEVCGRLKANPVTAGIPVIFLTAKTDAVDEAKGFELGAVDYISKPISPPIVMARIATHLHLKRVSDFLRDKNLFLEREVERRTREIGMIQDVTMVAIGSLAETRDNETGNHIRRTQYYIRILAEKLKDHSDFNGSLSDTAIERLYKSAPLHDIGKVGIPDGILKKPGRLEPDEFEIMKTHTTLGHAAIVSAEERLDSRKSFLSVARELTWSHHEKWDGSGYPRGLSGEDIPLPGRLMAIPDVYDALISKRVYKKAFTHGEAVEIIEKGAGTHFDPRIAAVFQTISGTFNEIARNFSDSE